MNEYDYLHETEDVWLVPDQPRRASELWAVLPKAGLSLADDIFVLDRATKIPLWQARSVVAVHVLLGQEEIYEEDGVWDRLRLRYLLATLPAENVSAFVETAARVSALLNLPMTYRGRVVNPEELRSSLDRAVDELRESIGEPGSREVAATIEMTYPRR